MNRLLLGPVGSGKTTRLLEAYHSFVRGGVKTGEILVLVMSATTVSDWRTRINLPASGNLNIFTYFGLVQREITRHWPAIDARLPDGGKCAEPVFMTTETAHYLMGLLVDKFRAEGYFPAIRATSQQIAIQLIDNLNQAAINGISIEQAGLKLAKASGQDMEKRRAFEESTRLMRIFRHDCEISRCLDYSLCVELFNTFLLQDQAYFDFLAGSWRYLLVDSLEETVPATQDLVVKLLRNVKEAHLAYDPCGGHGTFFGADPVQALDRVRQYCQVVELEHSHLSTPEMTGFARTLASRITSRDAGSSYKRSMVKGQIVTQLRGEMLTEVGTKILQLVDRGAGPDDIAVIAPQVDKVLEFALGQSLARKGIPLANLTRGKRLLDQPFAQALISLALLVYPEWRLELNFSGLVQTLSILLKLDPVRSALLADAIFKHKLQLPDLDTAGLRGRLGFENSERYELLKIWIEHRRDGKPELEMLFQQVFGELLAPLLPGELDLLACRQVIDSVTKFNRVMRRYSVQTGFDFGRGFLAMVLSGTLAAETLFRPPENTGKVLLATPYTFLLSPYVPAVKYQFWLDVAGEQWMRGSTKELTNPHVLCHSWNETVLWDDAADQTARAKRLASFVQSLLGKCSGGLYTASSYLNSQGYEQDGPLAHWLDEQGGDRND